MTDSPIMNTLGSVVEHLEEDDPQPKSIMISDGHVTMMMESVDALLDWSTIIEESGTDTRVTYVAERLWKQREREPSPTVITVEYVWDEDERDTQYRLCASSPLTMDQLAAVDMDARVEVTREQVETLVQQGYGKPIEPF